MRIHITAQVLGYNDEHQLELALVHNGMVCKQYMLE